MAARTERDRQVASGRHALGHSCDSEADLFELFNHACDQTTDMLKSGCRIEQAQLASDTRLIPLLALFSIIAWRLLTMVNPASPSSGNAFLTSPSLIEKILLCKKMSGSLLMPPPHCGFLHHGGSQIICDFGWRKTVG